MELKHLLSVTVATLTVLGSILFSMGPQDTWLATALWIAASVSLIATDFYGAWRLSRNAGSFLMWCAMAVFAPQFLVQTNWESRLQVVCSILICLQLILLFQGKDARVFGWLTVMSLLQAVVAARYCRGVAFGSLLIVYTIIGFFTLSLLALYSQWSRHSGGAEAALPLSGGGRWPLAGAQPEFAGSTSGSGRSGLVPELFVRLTVVCLAAMSLSVVIFYTAPRPRLPAWRPGDSRPEVSVVGFNDQITLGRLGETIESRQEVMQVRLLDPETLKPYPMTDDLYLRGTVVTSYSRGHWRRLPSVEQEGARSSTWIERPLDPETGDWHRIDTACRLGPPVTQRATMEPHVRPDDLFYVWPIVEPVHGRGLLYDRLQGRLVRKPSWGDERHTGEFTYEVSTAGLAGGHQPELVPAAYPVDRSERSSYRQLPSGEFALPRLTALARQWRHESGLSDRAQHGELARWFARQFSASGKFRYTLEGRERDTSIDPVEDFVSNNPAGHCEYFATALALMLRAEGIPSRVVLGYHCDEFDRRGHFYQVRQLHAHAWVEAYLAPDQIPDAMFRARPARWVHGGWLRLDPTPAGETGTQAANRTLWGAWQGRWHGVQRYWDSYIAGMDNAKQKKTVYEPIARAVRDFTNNFFSLRWWRARLAALWSSLAGLLGGGIMGWLAGVVLLAVSALGVVAAGWWMASRLRRLWRNLLGRRGGRLAARSSIGFFRRFEQLAAACGVVRGAGQTPREFALGAGRQMAIAGRRPELADRALEVAEAFYRVRFGRESLDPAAEQAVQQALDELKAAVAPRSPKAPRR